MVTKRIIIDMWQKMLEPVTVVQYEDAGRKLNIQLVYGGVPVDLTAYTVTFYAEKPDKNIVFNTCTVTDARAGEIEHVITGQTCNIPGVLNCWLWLAKTGATLESQQFQIRVQAAPDITGAAESTSEFGALEDAIANVSGMESRMVAKTDIVNNLTTDDPTKVLSAAQGVVLNDLLIGPHQTIQLYVNGSTGADTNPGTEASPFKTIQAAIESIPKVSCNSYNVNISGSAQYREDVSINGFIANSITLQRWGDISVTLNSVRGISAINNSCRLIFRNIRVEGDGSGVLPTDQAFYIESTLSASIESCETYGFYSGVRFKYTPAAVTGSGIVGGTVGVYAHTCSDVAISNSTCQSIYGGYAIGAIAGTARNVGGITAIGGISTEQGGQLLGF